jgi:hypothetical protein
MFIDEMNYDQCWALWRAINNAPVLTARVLFPQQPPSYVATTKLIAGYASNKGTALLYTISKQENSTRKMYIDIAASIYTKIPEWARSLNLNFLNLKEKSS